MVAVPIPSGGGKSCRRTRGEPPAKQRWRCEELIRSKVADRLAVKEARKRLKQLDKEAGRLRGDVPSAAWFDAVDIHGETFPPGKGQQAAPHEMRMRMSIASGRYTPRPAIRVEDFLDDMAAKKALFYEFPPSPSAVVIRRARDINVGRKPVPMSKAARQCGVETYVLRNCFALGFFNIDYLIPRKGGFGVPQAYLENVVLRDIKDLLETDPIVKSKNIGNPFDVRVI